MTADVGYDDHSLYDFTRQRNARLVCPIHRHRSTKGERLKLIHFNRTGLGRRILHARGVSIEPLFSCVKDAFGISVMPVYGFDNVKSYILMCVLVYQLAVYYNCVMDRPNPRCVKRMLGN
ncbi:MAG: transposase [Candidatus Nitrosotenuis sp.]